MYKVTLTNIGNGTERITLAVARTREEAEVDRKNWRRALGGKYWTVNRRPGLDTMESSQTTLGLSIVREV